MEISFVKVWNFDKAIETLRQTQDKLPTGIQASKNAKSFVTNRIYLGYVNELATTTVNFQLDINNCQNYCSNKIES